VFTDRPDPLGTGQAKIQLRLAILLLSPTTNRTSSQAMDPASQKRKASADSHEGVSSKRPKVSLPHLAPHDKLPDRDDPFDCVDAGRIC
jgi:hypothetical protein